ncbi:Ferric reduction oxidase chloroplastic [Hyphodiscus hymeniophilus]|uniref:Ferric reduction oxidase chloroplastic n=1 Tax=Hyphodiscus hymeniophilus TaxID=353542 RepID=A0A9P6VIW2_9HELO|nr:Ferric reduction oxidase chloroplastic [Hyphodiscus hymeniophilus]
MTRITPRTCLWPLAGSLVFTFSLSIGLTFRSNHHCFAGTCGEWLFPLQARLHVVVWYFWLAISVTVLAIRAFHPSMRKLLRTPLFERGLPLLGKQLTIGGILVFGWILSLYGIIVGIWWIQLKDYFIQRGIEGGVFSGNERLAAIALTGHLCDVTMGMAIIPISRHSALASFFKISVATTLTFHMITAYTLFTLVTIHGLLYASWVAAFNGLSSSLRMVFPVLNPTYLYRETWPGNHSSLGIWRASLIFTGSLTALIMLLIFITTLPTIRNRHFNLFYFTHLLGIVAIIIICLHASLMMWLLDWVMRIYELWAPLDGNIKALGKGCLSAPMPRRRLDGCACKSPLAHFYIYHSDTSLRELHPFTTTTHLASQNNVTHHSQDDINIRFLFRSRGKPTLSHDENTLALGFAPSFFALIRRLRGRKTFTQWTERLAEVADAEDTTTARSHIEGPRQLELKTSTTISKAAPVSLRLEGPYFTPADPARYRTVVCLVAGTGISGALAISGAFKEMERQSAMGNPKFESSPPRCAATSSASLPLQSQSQNGRTDSIASVGRDRVWTRCVIIWTVREDTHIDLPDLKTSPNSALEVRTNLTGPGKKRLDVGQVLDEILAADVASSNPKVKPSAWVYISGPNAFIAAGETACKERCQLGVEWYGARWDI